MPLEEAHLILLEQGTRIGVLYHVKKKDAATGTVMRQTPAPGSKVPLGSAINLWIGKV